MVQLIVYADHIYPGIGRRAIVSRRKHHERQKTAPGCGWQVLLMKDGQPVGRHNKPSMCAAQAAARSFVGRWTE